jgi:hypothetical protein
VVRGIRSLLIVCAAACVFAAAASADSAGSDPAQNYPLGKLPFACTTAPTGKACVNAGVYYLDRARASLGQPAYDLPADFVSLSQAQQMFILTNLDRVQYGLTPIPGLTAELNKDVLTTGVQAGMDPLPPDGVWSEGWTANWAAGYANDVLAYEGWMYDDGLGGPNIDCTPSDQSGCWGHRHNVLWEFDPSAVLAMGAAAGTGPDRRPGYAILLFGGVPPDPAAGDPGYTPTYSYTWSQAVADGAGTNTYDPGVPDTAVCVVPNVMGKTLSRAKATIVKAHCGVGRIYKRHTPYRKGIVAVQNLEPGKTLAPGSKIKLIVSLGLKR